MTEVLTEISVMVYMNVSGGECEVTNPLIWKLMDILLEIILQALDMIPQTEVCTGCMRREARMGTRMTWQSVYQQQMQGILRTRYTVGKQSCVGFRVMSS